MVGIFSKASLQPIQDKHFNLLFNWRNQARIRNFMFSSEKITLDQHQEWFKLIKNNKRKIVKVFYYDGVPQGIVSFTDIDLYNKRCNWGIYLGNEDAPKGIGVVMGFLALDFIFEQTGIRKVCAEILDFNKRSISYHQKLGFYFEGSLKQHVVREDNYYDVILMVLFKDKWKEARTEVNKQIEGMKI
jgi:UDP-4-amino-4,6-dideoxy-N-acetyl-beta-L-altrosamine N-acetyltransferase